MNKYMTLAAVLAFAGAMAGENTVQPGRFTRTKSFVGGKLTSVYNNVTNNRVTNYVGQTRPYKFVANCGSKVKSIAVTGKNKAVARWNSLSPKVKKSVKVGVIGAVLVVTGFVAKKLYDKSKTSKNTGNNNVKQEEITTSVVENNAPVNTPKKKAIGTTGTRVNGVMVR